MIHVLVVEDDEDLSDMLSYKLDSEGYDVTVYSDGTEAWEYLKGTEDSPDLVLLDVMIPGLNGFAVLKRIRDEPELEETPVVLLTGRGKEEDVVKGLELGADDYVTKPFSPSALVARVRRLT